MKKKEAYSIGSDNVFADLNISEPGEFLAKAELARQINNIIESKELTQDAASILLGIDQPKISALRNGKLSGFSLARLFKFLNLLGQDITIHIKPKARSRKKAHILVDSSFKDSELSKQR